MMLNVELSRSVNMAELRKLRRQFISYSKMHPTENTGQISNMFVQYLNKSLHWYFIAPVLLYIFPITNKSVLNIGCMFVYYLQLK